MNREESELYLRTRADQRFTVIQTVLLAEFSGTTTGNAQGRLPFHMDENGQPEPIRPDCDGPYSYWDHVDALLKLAGSLGLYVALLPTWGDKFNQKWGKGPEIFSRKRHWITENGWESDTLNILRLSGYWGRSSSGDEASFRHCHVHGTGAETRWCPAAYDVPSAGMRFIFSPTS
ncbi:DUF4038 domain-containing protein [Paenibacillus amylolyticus]|nr:DUF4038 domain-containing protein [Paenibacillus amylolyticus]WFR61026.1 DUF4038 domain-containing protein [Paenibacillus amylolyticus]